MEKGRLSKAYKIILAVTIAIMLVACMSISIFGTQSFAKDANNGYNLATDDMWDSSANAFNMQIIQELFDHLTGKRNASIDDVDTLFSGTPIYTNLTTGGKEGDPNGTWHQEYSSKVVKSDILNANANLITAGTQSAGLTVKLKGKEFRVTSLTRTMPSNENPDGDIVATLMLKEPEQKTYQWNSHTNQPSTSAEPSNMYGTSDIRKTLASSTGEFADLAIGDFASEYLVKPKDIGYQIEQSLSTRWKKRNTYSIVNEALGKVNGFIAGFDYFNNGGAEGSPAQLDKRQKYTSWGEDYVWLPSLVETGSNGWTHSIWGMPIAHIASQIGLSNWLRSGPSFNSAANAYTLNQTAMQNETGVNAGHSIRPALHLNLSVARSEYSPRNPENVESIYTGKVMKIGELGTFPKWYNANIFGDPNRIALTYYRGSDTSDMVNGVSDADEYWVKAEIQLEWIAEGALEDVEVKFRGEADTGDPNHMETDTVRWFKWVVKPKEISVIYSSTSGKFDFEIKDNASLSVNYDGIVDGDDVVLDFSYYSQSDSSKKIDIDNDMLNIAALKANKYSLTFNLSATQGTDNANYYIDADAQVQEFIINAREAEINSVTWQYSQDGGGTVVTVPNGMGDTIGTPFRLPYNGDTYSFEILADALATMGVEIDIASYDRGYDNTLHTNASDNIEEIKVRIVPNVDYAFYDSNGSISVDQFREFSLFFKLDKMQIAKPSRGNQTLIYTGVVQTFTAQGFDAEWMHANGNTGINADNYTARYELKDNANTVWAGSNSTEYIDITWTIDKAKFDLSGVKWSAREFVFNGVNQKIELEGLPNGLSAKFSNNEKKDAGEYAAKVMEFVVEDADNYTIPVETNKGSYIGDFEWSKDWSIAKMVIPSKWSTMPYEDPNGNEYRLSIIDGDWGNLLTGQIKYTYYRIDGSSETKLDSVDDIVFVLGEETWYKVKAEIKAEFNKNYALDGDMAEKKFAVGANTIAVEVWLAVSEFIFDGTQKVVTLINDSGLSVNDFIINYYDSNDQPLSGAPTNAGTYHVEVTLADGMADDYYLVDGTLEFVIAPKRIAEPTITDKAYVYNGEEQTLAVDGFDDLWIRARGEQSGTDAGIYTAVFGLSDIDNTVWVGGGTDDIDIVWEIAKAKLSLEGAAWGYDINKPFVYEWLDGAAVVHEITLNGLTEYLAEKAIYVNNTSSIVGVKTAGVTFDIDVDNYEFDDPATLDALREQVWEVKARIFDLPNVSDSLVFDNTEHNLADFAGLDSGWEEYFDVNFTLDGDPSFSGPMAKNAGNYNVRFAIKSEHKNGNTYYVEWAGNDKLPKTTKVAIEQREVVVDEWQDGKPPVPSIDSADADYYQVVYTFEGQIISLDDIDQYYGKTLKAEVRLADSMSAENVAIVAADGVETFADFIIFDSADEPYTVELPNSFNIQVEYDRDRMRFEWADFGGIAEDGQYLTISLPEGGFGVGTHNVTVRIRSTQNAQWSDGTRDEIELTVEIIKGKIIANWDNATPPELIFGDETDELIEYKTFDADGNEVTIFDKGMTYTTSAFIRAEFADKYAFWVNEEYVDTVEKEFTVPSTVANPPTIAEPNLEFNGEEQIFVVNGFDSEYMTMTGELTFTNAGKYSVTIGLKNDAVWADGTTEDITLEFEITKKKIAIPTIGGSLTFNGGDQTFTPTGFDDKWMTAGGNVGKNAGDYKATFTLKDSENTEWADGSIAEIVIDWQIGKAQISATWDKDGDIPTLSGLPSGLPVDAIVYTYQDADGKVVAEDKLEKGKDYTVKAELKDEYKANYGFGAEMSYELKSDKFAFGGLGGNGDNDDTNGGIADNLPLWQIIVTAAGLLLGLIFFAMSIANGVKTKKLKGETADKRLGHAQSYAALPLLGAISGEAFLGMSDKVWTILAAAAAAFCLVGLTMMLVTGRQKVTAAQKLDKAEREELARVEREERLEREEKARIEREEAARAERQQRENEMKMLFMMMSKRGGGGNGASEDGPIVYHTAAAPVQDVKEIVTQVVAALMPGMQAQLPPINMANYEKMEKLVDQQMQVLDRQTRIIESMKGEREQGKDDNDEGG